jgi:NAD(P)-dependent dehydrogenase (short-subunit alcohol dehydrogenase family)
VLLARQDADTGSRSLKGEFNMDIGLAGKRAIVTGGSGGIGKAIALQLAREGVDVVVAARRMETLEATAAEIGSLTGRRVVPLTVDTASKASVDAMVAGAIEALGGIDILVNSAALPGGISAARQLQEIVDSEALDDIDIKVIGYLRTARALAPHLAARGWGRIINIGGLALYNTGRPIATLRNVGVAAITKNLADELGPRGINVTAVHPPATRTERTDAATEARAAARSSIGRMVDAGEVAAVVAFLASPLSVAINGEAIALGGGSPGTIHY